MSGQINGGITMSNEMIIRVTSDDICKAIRDGEFVLDAVEDIAMECFDFLPDEYLDSEGNGMYEEYHPQRELAKRIAERLTIEDFEWLKNEIELI